MRCAILSDIHANLPALQAVIKDAEQHQVTRFWNLGDLLDYGPDPIECVALARERFDPQAWMVGDHETGLVDDHLPREWFDHHALAALDKTRELLQKDARVWQWCEKNLHPSPRRMKRFVTVGARRYLLAHGSLMSPLTEYLFPWDELKITGEFFRIRQTYLDARFKTARQRCFFGQTHWPMLIKGMFEKTATGEPQPAVKEIFTTFSTDVARNQPVLQNLKARLGEHLHDLAETDGHPIHLGNEPVIVNPGSVGQPRDGNPNASYAILDTHKQTIQFRRVPYERLQLYRRLRANGFPIFLIERLEKGI
jgi:hypothetical protein